MNHAPHVVILGSGASIAAYHDWGREGDPPSLMPDLVDTLDLRKAVEAAGFTVDGLDFESFYDDLVYSGKQGALRSLIESRVYCYFSSLKLPDKPTIYDYLILSLREKDILATFNWDPFLLQAYMRNENIAPTRRPRIAFLHGNVMIGVCHKDQVAGVNGRVCTKCRNPLVPSKLLYPVKHKDYNSDKFVKTEWDVLRHHINCSYLLTIFGYGAPKTDVEARTLMLDVWKENKSLELAEVEIVDIRARDDIETTWKEFFFSHHYVVTDSIFKSYLFQHPRRSCDAFSSATLMCEPWYDNPYPRFGTLAELQAWVRPLIEEEEQYEREKRHFSGDPLLPNEKV